MNEKTRRAVWFITRQCNLDCRYCFLEEKPPAPRPDPEAVVRTLKSAHKKWFVVITGGEPFLVPDFAGICRTMTRHFRLRITTNLSFGDKLRDFVSKVDPARIAMMNVSLHIEERERLGTFGAFLENLELLRQHGFRFRVTYVLTPSLITRFSKDFEFFKQRGIEPVPMPFKGNFEGRHYPRAYTRQERQFLRRYNPESEQVMPFRSRGLSCFAGRWLVCIHPDGTITRCPSVTEPAGEVGKKLRLNNGPVPCTAAECNCWGEKLIHRGWWNLARRHCRNSFAGVSA